MKKENMEKGIKDMSELEFNNVVIKKLKEMVIELNEINDEKGK